MTVKRISRKWLIIACLWILAVPLVFGLALSLVSSYLGTLVFAIYPGPLEFMGHSRLSGTMYVSIKWMRDPAAPASCPLIVHLPVGDVGEQELAAEGGLLKLGFHEVPYQIAPELAALPRPHLHPKDLGIVKFGQGDLRIATQHTAGQLTSVDIWVVEPGHETVAWSPGGTRYSISVDGRRITLPLSESELVGVLGVPAARRKDY
jgi:hypothetical protein